MLLFLSNSYHYVCLSHSHSLTFSPHSLTVGIPSVRWAGVEGDYNVMVIDLLGKSLEDVFNECGRKFGCVLCLIIFCLSFVSLFISLPDFCLLYYFSHIYISLFIHISTSISLKTVLSLADQLLCRLEIVHTKCYIHRDIKPDNFLMGRGSRRHLVNVIDFGLAKYYRYACVVMWWCVWCCYECCGMCDVVCGCCYWLVSHFHSPLLCPIIAETRAHTATCPTGKARI